MAESEKNARRSDEAERSHFSRLLSMAIKIDPNPDKIEKQLRRIADEVGRMFN